MSEEYGGDIISISDDEGNSYLLEHLDTIEIEDDTYMAFVPADVPQEDERYGMLLLKVVEVDGMEEFENIEDPEEEEMVYRKFMERLFSEEEE